MVHTVVATNFVEKSEQKLDTEWDVAVVYVTAVETFDTFRVEDGLKKSTGFTLDFVFHLKNRGESALGGGLLGLIATCRVVFD